MNSQLIKVGKATLATVMATSVGMSSFTLLPIFAEESKDVTNEELPVEPVNEEAKATNKEQPLEEEKLLKEGSTLPQSSSYPGGKYKEDAFTVDELKTMLSDLINQAETI